jgi:hypothetical protein
VNQRGFAHSVIVLLLLLLGVIAGAGMLVWKHASGPKPADKTAKFVTAAPVDCEQMEAISKLRSCGRHDYSGKNIEGVIETERSMKYYATPLKSLLNTTNKVWMNARLVSLLLGGHRVVKIEFRHIRRSLFRNGQTRVCIMF